MSQAWCRRLGRLAGWQKPAEPVAAEGDTSGVAVRGTGAQPLRAHSAKATADPLEKWSTRSCLNVVPHLAGRTQI